MKNSTLTLISIVFLTLFFSCSSGELTRNKAKKIIEKHYDFPLAESIEPYGIYDVYEKDISGILSRGLMAKYGKRRKYTLIGGRAYERTDYGDSFLMFDKEKDNRKIVSNALEIEEITGIKFNESKTKAEVELRLKRIDHTPWGEAVGKIYRNSTIDQEVKLEKYDDGWRVSSSGFLNFTTIRPTSELPHIFKKKSKSKNSKTPKLEFTTRDDPSMGLTLYLLVNEEEYEISEWEEDMPEINTYYDIDNNPKSDECIISASIQSPGSYEVLCVKKEGGDLKIIKTTNYKFDPSEVSTIKVIRL